MQAIYTSQHPFEHVVLKDLTTNIQSALANAICFGAVIVLNQTQLTSLVEDSDQALGHVTSDQHSDNTVTSLTKIDSLFITHLQSVVYFHSMTCRYDDVLDPQDIYSLLGLTAFYNGFFGQCSKAFTRLEWLPGIDDVSTLSSFHFGCQKERTMPEVDSFICTPPTLRRLFGSMEHSVSSCS